MWGTSGQPTRPVVKIFSPTSPFGPLDAVGGHEDGPGKLGELLALVLPGGSVVAVEMLVFLQFGITVGGQHLAVGVHIDALALALLENTLQILAESWPETKMALPFLWPRGTSVGTGCP